MVVVVYADPPWQYDFSHSKSRSIPAHYDTLDMATIELLRPEIKGDAVLFLWATAPKLKEALSVMEAWGFEYKTHAIWDKELQGMGYWFRGQHELLLVGTKGHVSPPTESLRIASVIRLRREGHSEKPDRVRFLIEQWYPNARKIELYARERFKNWETFGNERTLTVATRLSRGF